MRWIHCRSCWLSAFSGLHRARRGHLATRSREALHRARCPGDQRRRGGHPGRKDRRRRPQENRAIPKGARISECSGGVVTAGFQNSHVHFMEEVWNDAAHAPAAGHSQGLESMLTRYGFTTVFDTGFRSVTNTVALRERIEKGEIRGPRILTAGIPLYPPDGIPFYLRDLPPEAAREDAQQPKNAAEAREDVRQNLASRRGRHQALPAHLAGHEESAIHVDRSRARGRGRNSRAGQTRARPSDQSRRRSGRAGRPASTSSCTPRWVKRQPWDAGVIARDEGEAHVGHSRRSSSGPMSCARMDVPPEVIDKLVSATLQRAAELFRGGRAGPLRHRRGLHARIRSQRRIPFHGAGRPLAHADPRVAHHGAGRTLE